MGSSGHVALSSPPFRATTYSSGEARTAASWARCRRLDLTGMHGAAPLRGSRDKTRNTTQTRHEKRRLTAERVADVGAGGSQAAGGGACRIQIRDMSIRIVPRDALNEGGWSDQAIFLEGPEQTWSFSLGSRPAFLPLPGPF